MLKIRGFTAPMVKPHPESGFIKRVFQGKSLVKARKVDLCLIYLEDGRVDAPLPRIFLSFTPSMPAAAVFNASVGMKGNTQARKAVSKSFAVTKEKTIIPQR